METVYDLINKKVYVELFNSIFDGLYYEVGDDLFWEIPDRLNFEIYKEVREIVDEKTLNDNTRSVTKDWLEGVLNRLKVESYKKIELGVSYEIMEKFSEGEDIDI